MQYKKYNSFILIYPNSKISDEVVLGIFKCWDISYDIINFEIKDLSFFNELYDLNRKLSLNKAVQCGIGKARLYLYTLPINIVKFRPTFSEIKRCNIFAFDLKHAFRALDKKNLVHGSTDYDEYIKDSEFILRYKESGNTLLTSNIKKPKFLNLISKSKSFKKRILNRVIYTYQKLDGYFSFILYKIKCSGVNEYKISPCMLSKWRWSSKYFSMDIGSLFFVKIPNKYENALNEYNISQLLETTGHVEKIELIELFGNQAIKKKWISMRPLSLDEFYDGQIINQIINLFGSMYRLGVHHADIKYDNLQYDIDNDSILLIDFGLSSVIDQRIDSNKNITSFEFYRWNDGWNLLDFIITQDPIRMMTDVKTYTAYANLAGQYAVVDNDYVLA